MAEAPARAEPPAPPPAPTVILGLLCAIFGGLVLSHSVLGLPFLVAGAWFTTGRGLRELRRGLVTQKRALVGWALGLLFFLGAMVQAWFALLPMLPLFAASALLLPPVREACFALTGMKLPPLLRETLVVALLCAYGYLVAYDLAARVEAARPALVR